MFVRTGFRAAKSAAPRRAYSTASHHQYKPSSDRPWLIGSALLTLPAVFYLTKPPTSSEGHHAHHPIASPPAEATPAPDADTSGKPADKNSEGEKETSGKEEEEEEEEESGEKTPSDEKEEGGEEEGGEEKEKEDKSKVKDLQGKRAEGSPEAKAHAVANQVPTKKDSPKAAADRSASPEEGKVEGGEENAQTPDAPVPAESSSSEKKE